LYRLVGEYLPDMPDEDSDILEFIGKVVDNMIKAGQLTNYADAILLTSGKTIEDIKDLEPPEIIKLFVTGLSENNIFAFKEFLDEVNFNGI
jgi:hypothetical protein